MNDYLSKPVRLSQLIEKINLFFNYEQSTTIQAERTNSAEENNSNLDILYLEPSCTQNKETEVNIELVDEEILQQMIQDTSADVLPLLIDHYIEESNQRLATINDAFINKDAKVLEFENHTLGSSSLALGNRVLSNLARTIEHLCYEGKSHLAFEYHQELMALATHSLEAINQRKALGFTQPIE